MHQYDAYEKKWNFYGTVADELLRHLLIGSTSSVLELACGSGACTIRLARAAPLGSVVALDLSAGMVEMARSNAAAAGVSNVEFVQGDVRELTSLTRGRKFDFAACNSAFWHFPEPERVLGALLPLLTEGGVFGLSISHRAIASANRDLGAAGPPLAEPVSTLAELFSRCGFETSESSFEFVVSKESRREWREIPVFSNSLQGRRHRSRLELRGRRRGDLLHDPARSRWTIMVARPKGGWTPT